VVPLVNSITLVFISLIYVSLFPSFTAADADPGMIFLKEKLLEMENLIPLLLCAETVIGPGSISALSLNHISMVSLDV
jgi:hypothetical protein